MYVLLLLCASAPSPIGYEWLPWKDGSAEYALTYNGQQIGSYNADRDVYRPYDRRADSWGNECRPPIEPPMRNCGVIASKLSATTRYTSNGKEISTADAYADPRPVPPDGGGMYTSPKQVVIIGRDAETEPVLAALLATEGGKALCADYVVQTFRPDDWQVSKSGFKTDGQPTIYFVDASGTVLYRRDDFACGADGLAEALRDADPDYQPANDPGPSNVLGGVSGEAGAAAVGIGLFLALFFGVLTWKVKPWLGSASSPSRP